MVAVGLPISLRNIICSLKHFLFVDTRYGIKRSCVRNVNSSNKMLEHARCTYFADNEGISLFNTILKPFITSKKGRRLIVSHLFKNKRKKPFKRDIRNGKSILKMRNNENMLRFESEIRYVWTSMSWDDNNAPPYWTRGMSDSLMQQNTKKLYSRYWYSDRNCISRMFSFFRWITHTHIYVHAHAYARERIEKFHKITRKYAKIN